MTTAKTECPKQKTYCKIRNEDLNKKKEKVGLFMVAF